jgi:two-component system chemotaxis sensor kinase CheA
MSDFNPQDFIQDFYEEASEHLRSIRANFLALERSLAPSRASVEMAVERVSLFGELFRSFHTLKGLAGMVGLEGAAQLSHAVESILREMQNAHIEVTPAVVDRLIGASSTLAGLIESVRTPGKPDTEVTAEIEALAAFLPEEGGRPARPPAADQGPDPVPAPASPLRLPPELAGSLNEVDRHKIQAASAAGRSFFQAVFTPDKTRAGQALNVNTVRQYLTENGEILKAVPLIADAGVQFMFLVATTQAADLELPGLELKRLPELSQTQAGGEPALPAPEHAVPLGHSAVFPVAMTIRVDLERLDDLMHLVSKMVVCHSRLADGFARLPRLSGPVVDQLNQAMGQIERNLYDLRQATMRMRMVPLAEVFSHMPLAVRDLGRALGKEVRLVMEGEGTEIDRVLVERLLEPLLHLVRNAIAHGIETPAVRAHAGKPAQGTLTLRGKPEGDHILVSVSDDGRGVDVEQVAAKAVALGWLEEARPLSNAEALDLLCRPGLSTLGEATLGAGRGVGMEVVMQMASSVGGSLSMESLPWQGTTFHLRLPLTLTIVNAILVECGGERYAIPQSAVNEVIEIDPGQVVRLESGELLPYREGSLALIRLCDLFHLAISQKAGPLYGLVSGNGGRQAALVVEKLGGLREVVVRTISDPLAARPGILGATELGDGRLVLILDVPRLMNSKTSEV